MEDLFFPSDTGYCPKWSDVLGTWLQVCLVIKRIATNRLMVTNIGTTSVSANAIGKSKMDIILGDSSTMCINPGKPRFIRKKGTNQVEKIIAQNETAMTRPSSDIAFTPSVKAIQKQFGSRKQYARMEEAGGFSEAMTANLTNFIAERDFFYLATASADGQPYIQHRGGPKGFLNVIDKRTLAFADFTGNRQYISVGNLAENNKAFIFLMDYTTRTRIKIWGTAEVVADDQALLKDLTDASYKGRVERAIRFHIKAWDVNCRQHITQRFTTQEFDSIVQPLRTRITELKAENERLQIALSKAQTGHGSLIDTRSIQ